MDGRGPGGGYRRDDRDDRGWDDRGRGRDDRRHGGGGGGGAYEFLDGRGPGGPQGDARRGGWGGDRGPGGGYGRGGYGGGGGYNHRGGGGGYGGGYGGGFGGGPQDERRREERRQLRLRLLKEKGDRIWGNTPSPSPDLELGPAAGPSNGGPAAGGVGDDPGAEERRRQEQEAEDARKAEAEAQQLAAFETFLEAHHQKLEADRERARREAENVEAGPELPSVARAAPGSYGKALLPGEGDAMAAFVQAGKRIPRRGEVGLTSEQISGYENLGYVMSGSRHSRMNAIRIRKENQVYTAEEKAALSMIDFEEKQKKEAKVMADMQKLVSKHLDS